MNGSQTTLAIPPSEADPAANSLLTDKPLPSPLPSLGGKGSSRLPQTISHRGYKSKFPENTLAAVKGAIESKTDALEIDLHLTKDGEIVLSHDPTLQRCFGIKKKIGDCDWAYLKTLRTLQPPHEPMPRLAEILEYINQSGREHIWVLLDIKLTNDPDLVMRRIAQTISSISPVSSPFSSPRPWQDRVVLGFWSGDYIPLRNRYLPQFPMALICFDFKYARQFLHVEDLAYNVNQRILMSPLGKGFLEDVRAARRQIYLWTVNAPNLMRWAIRQGVDGVITDDPALYIKVREAWERERKDGVVVFPELQTDRLTFGQRVEILLFVMLAVTFGWVLKHRISKRMKGLHLGEQKAS
ncbi:hypothetical protein PDE_06080 [Penicillium oxalicum 114-2]|uniref:GP-PDE domain-containing protein n=1 Tax=Penicillium oxalicum (strain 114-2 / CGMCC 5302) TaxID=933388 RepID=S7ZKF6_PENO1|nr:hypothetical protein PDE_06080 [Penicillium oxalicum 114-2]